MMGKMHCDIDLDWCTYRCPCGASFCTRFEMDPTEWLKAHKPHTDGTSLEHTTARGQTVWAVPEPDRVVPLK